MRGDNDSTDDDAGDSSVTNGDMFKSGDDTDFTSELIFREDAASEESLLSSLFVKLFTWLTSSCEFPALKEWLANPARWVADEVASSVSRSLLS